MDVPRPFVCEDCGKAYRLKHHLTRHTKTTHRNDSFMCRECGELFARAETLRRHTMTLHRQQPLQPFNPAYRPDFAVAGPSTAPDITSVPDPQASTNPSGGHVCEGCGRMFARKDILQRHTRFSCRARHEGAGPSGQQPVDEQVAPPPPSSASTDSPAPSSSSGAEEDEDNVLPGDLSPHGFEEFETAFHGRLKSYRLIEPAEREATLVEFLESIRETVVSLMRRILEHVVSIKANIFVECEFVNAQEETCRRSFKTKNVPLFRSSDIEEIVNNFTLKLRKEQEECQMKGSGWSFLRVINMEIRINVYRPLGGSSYIQLPHYIQNKKAVCNVLNDADERCFEYSILTKYIEDPGRQQLRPIHFTAEVRARANLNFTGMEYPVPIEKISTFERNNPGVSINIYGLEERRKSNGQLNHTVYPLRVSKEELPNHFDLLFLTNETTTHYAWIKNFERLVRSQITRSEKRLVICKRCFAHFDGQPNKLGLTADERLAEHRRYCKNNAPLRTDVSEETKIKFKHPERTQRSRFTVYADFESMLVPIEGAQPLNPPPVVPAPYWDPATRRRELPHHHHRGDVVGSQNVTTRDIHKPYAYAYYVHDEHRSADEGDCDDNIDIGGNTFSKLRLYRGEDAALHFIKALREDMERIGKILYGRRVPRNPPQLTVQEESAFQVATMCYLCGSPFTQDDDKVRDHQHSPPYKYRGAAHRSCNLLYTEQDTVNVYLHNLSNYDAHFIVRELGVDRGDVDVLANTEEKYISFSKRFHHRGAGKHNRIKLRFVDSYRFLQKSLAGLVSIMPVEKLIISRARYTDQEEFDLLRRKGVFPYEYVSSMEVLDESVLPPKAAFGDNVTDEDYAHAQCVWDKFDCQTLGDYADIYLRTDVLLLADVFEGFRDMCQTHYSLDPAHYITLPSYAWDVMLFKTGVVLDTLQEVDQYLFFEKGIRGGLTQCVTRRVVANNKYTRREDSRRSLNQSGGGDRDGRYASTSQDDGVVVEENDDDTFLMYYDANNLYGWAMSEPLPTGEFQWLSRPEIESLNWESLPADGEYGYVLEVDLEYPRDRDLQDKHRDLPFCPEVRRAPADRLPYSSDIRFSSGAGKSPKLMVTLMDKYEYVVHMRYLQQALENGLRIRHIHRVLRFKQSAWLKPYVAMNTALRQNAKNKFEIELFKLMVNAVYGMSLQNVRKHINLKFATSRKTYTKYVAKSNFCDRIWYTEDLALLHMSKVRVVLDKPVYVGMCILDHSKWWMYGFHYKMVERYGLNRIRMTYMDTDGIVYALRTRDVYQDMLVNSDVFDTSNYPRDHVCYDGRNARVLGKFKDEAGGKTIRLFVGLMAKLYCMVFGSETTMGNGDDIDVGVPPPLKRAKGINRGVVDRELAVQDYENCLLDGTVKFTDNPRFQSRHHLIYTVVVRKRTLAPYDDKRYVLPEDGVSTLPWGHYAIPPAPPPLPPDLLPIEPIPQPPAQPASSPPATLMEIE